MDLKNKLIIFLSLICHFSYGKVYPELMAKQANDNIRFISLDGKFTYYQKRSGSLHFSRNYKIIDLLKGPMGTQYTIYATPTRNKLLFTQNENIHTFLSLRNKERIFVSNFGESNIREVGMGISPRLLLEDNWISYYDPYTYILSFEHATNYALKFAIKLNNRINPYFIPDVVMLDDNSVIYSDLGENGNYGLIKYNRASQTSDIIFKAESPANKLELRFCNGKLFLGEIGIGGSDIGTTISELPNDLKDIKNKNIIYRSTLNDLGNITCDYFNNNLYFIRNVGSRQVPLNEIVELNVNTKALNTLTDLKNITSIINMDGIILTTEKGKIIIVKGENEFKNADRLKVLPKEKIIETESDNPPAAVPTPAINSKDQKDSKDPNAKKGAK